MTLARRYLLLIISFPVSFLLVLPNHEGKIMGGDFLDTESMQKEESGYMIDDWIH